MLRVAGTIDQTWKEIIMLKAMQHIGAKYTSSL